SAILQIALRKCLKVPIHKHRHLLGRGERQLASRILVEASVVELQAHGGSSSAMSSPTVTGFTGFVWSRTVDADAVGGAAVAGEVAGEAGAAGAAGPGAGADAVGAGADVAGPGTGAAVAAGPGSCGVGVCGMNCEPPRGVRQSKI